MIRSLRRRHLRMILTLAVLLAILLTLALAARPDPPVMETLPWVSESRS